MIVTEKQKLNLMPEGECSAYLEDQLSEKKDWVCRHPKAGSNKEESERR